MNCVGKLQFVLFNLTPETVLGLQFVYLGRKNLAVSSVDVGMSAVQTALSPSFPIFVFASLNSYPSVLGKPILFP